MGVPTVPNSKLGPFRTPQLQGSPLPPALAQSFPFNGPQKESPCPHSPRLPGRWDWKEQW